LTDRRPPIEKLTLAMDLVAEAREVSPAVRRKLGAVLSGEGVPEQDTSWLLQVRKAHFTRSLRQSVRVREDVYAVDRLMTKQDYELFLDDLGLFASSLREPLSRSPGDNLDILVGAEYEDASTFAKWVNQVTGNTWEYRLPNDQDAIHENDRVMELLDLYSAAIWTEEGRLVLGAGGQSSPAERDSLLARALLDFLKAEDAFHAPSVVLTVEEEESPHHRVVKRGEVRTDLLLRAISSVPSFFLGSGVGSYGLREQEKYLVRRHEQDATSSEVVASVSRYAASLVPAEFINQDLRVLAARSKSARLSRFASARGLRLIADMLDCIAKLGAEAFDMEGERRRHTFRATCALGVAACNEILLAAKDVSSKDFDITDPQSMGEEFGEMYAVTTRITGAFVGRYSFIEGFLPWNQAILLMRSAGTFSSQSSLVRGRHRVAQG
jgi:hypothetical protein